MGDLCLSASAVVVAIIVVVCVDYLCTRSMSWVLERVGEEAHYLAKMNTSKKSKR